jgi:hypothetical protein
VWVVASNFSDEDLPANERGDRHDDLSSRADSTARSARTEARAELRDRETYYAELRFAVHCESRSIPASRPAPDDDEGSVMAWGASGNSAHQDCARQARASEDGGAGGESWDEMIARFGDTWT